MIHGLYSVLLIKFCEHFFPKYMSEIIVKNPMPGLNNDKEILSYFHFAIHYNNNSLVSSSIIILTFFETSSFPLR